MAKLETKASPDVLRIVDIEPTVPGAYEKVGLGRHSAAAQSIIVI